MLALFSALVAAGAVAADLTTITDAPAPTAAVAGDKRESIYTYETESALPLTDYSIPYTALPYQIMPFAFERGPQSGYNQCNSTTENGQSQCQTMVVNSLKDFCIWGMPGQYPNYETVGDEEAAMVAYCSLAGHGTRIMPPGTITAAQFLVTPAYIEVVGMYQQNATDMNPTDSGGEEDPHGADNLGNPLGSWVGSTNFTGGDGTDPVQATSWNNFIGSNIFCIKLCNPNYQTNLNYCENRYDIIGCSYNMPAAYAPGEFLACDSDLQDVVGTYTGSDGQTSTWSQPESLTAGQTLPWTPRIPASSNCVTYQSSDLWPTQSLGYQSSNNLFAGGVTQAASGSGSMTTASGSKATSATHSGKTDSASASRSSGTGSAASASASKSSGAGRSVASKMGGLSEQVAMALLTVGGVAVGAVALFA